MRWGVVVGVVLGVLLLLLRPGARPAVHARTPRCRRPSRAAWSSWPWASRSPGFVFVVDGVLIGAGDGPWLARAMLVTLAAYLPVILAVNAAGDWLLEGGTTAGQVDAVIWLWLAFTAFMAVRGTLMWMRVRTDRWMVTGAIRT